MRAVECSVRLVRKLGELLHGVLKKSATPPTTRQRAGCNEEEAAPSLMRPSLSELGMERTEATTHAVSDDALGGTEISYGTSSQGRPTRSIAERVRPAIEGTRPREPFRAWRLRHVG
jgi:hypothetical protein